MDTEKQDYGGLTDIKRTRLSARAKGRKMAAEDQEEFGDEFLETQ